MPSVGFTLSIAHQRGVSKRYPSGTLHGNARSGRASTSGSFKVKIAIATGGLSGRATTTGILQASRATNFYQIGAIFLEI